MNSTRLRLSTIIKLDTEKRKIVEQYQEQEKLLNREVTRLRDEKTDQIMSKILAQYRCETIQVRIRSLSWDTSWLSMKFETLDEDFKNLDRHIELLEQKRRKLYETALAEYIDAGRRVETYQKGDDQEEIGWNEALLRYNDREETLNNQEKILRQTRKHLEEQEKKAFGTIVEKETAIQELDRRLEDLFEKLICVGKMFKTEMEGLESGDETLRDF